MNIQTDAVSSLGRECSRACGDPLQPAVLLVGTARIMGEPFTLSRSPRGSGAVSARIPDRS